GGQQRYSDLAIETCLTLRAVFGLPLRQTQGFVRSLLRLMQTDLPVPIFRRFAGLRHRFRSRLTPGQPVVRSP
ncbi:transposase, partial [Paracoccus seriniphilus]|uniref:transposase n=1 Tax=Paracoccus seriniphilus TaxID=184748 RepID=UPI0035698914